MARLHVGAHGHVRADDRAAVEDPDLYEVAELVGEPETPTAVNFECRQSPSSEAVGEDALV